ncbi:T9SS type A sorting domain-containing protein [Ekhidna sp.]|uniref:T9SS type A sorting domain-containing protein n=1 Tax=Ekhidna sp. TaxID=2608089 RepID=UPI003B50A4EE
MKKLTLLPFIFIFILTAKAQTALDPQEIRHNSFVAIVDPEDGSTSFLMQVSRDDKFIDLVVDGQWIVSGYANDPLHKNSPLRVKNLESNTTYYYRFSYDTSDPKYGNVEFAHTWDPPATPVLQPPIISTNEVTFNWESDDPDVTGFEIWVYGASGCFQGGTMVQDNILTVGPDDRSLTYDFVFFDETTYRFSIYAWGPKGVYGDPDSKLAMSCACYESYNLSTLVEDYNIYMEWSEPTGELALYSLYDLEVEGESVPASFFSGSNGGGSSYNQFLNWEWDISGNWEIDHEKYVRNNKVSLIGSGPGTFKVKLVDPCTGAESAEIVYENKATQTITFDPISQRTFGDADFQLNATSSSGLPISYHSSNGGIATVSGNTVTIVGAGSTVITASQSGDDLYQEAEDVQQTLTVNKANQIISFGSLSDIKYSDDPYALSASSTSGLNVTFMSSDESIVEIINGNEANPVGVGTVALTASQSGDSDYNPAIDVDQQLTVSKGDQSIDFEMITGTYTVNGSGFSLNAIASSGLTVSFISSDENIVSISGSTVLIEGAGTATITAQQSGNSLYNAAQDVSQEVTIHKLSQTVTVPDLSGNSYTYGLSASPFQVTNSSGIENMIFESSDENVFSIQNVSNAGGGVFYVTIAAEGAGTATFIATQPGDDNYESESSSTTITINKSDQLIEFFSLTPVFFDENDFQISATAESGLPVTFISTDPSIASVTGTTVMVHNAGETTIIASQSGNANFEAATDVPQVLTVMKRIQTISFNTDMPQYPTFGDGPYDFNPSASSGLPVSIEIDDESVVTVENGIATIVGAGIATITANQLGNQNYHSKESQITVEVERSSQSITFNSLAQKNYGSAPFELTAESTSGLSISYSSGDESVATIDGNVVTIVGVGTTYITANQPGDDNYYAAGEKGQTLTVIKGDQVITFDEINDHEVGEIVMLSATSSSGLAVSYEVTGPATLDENTLTLNDQGSVTITASQTGNSNYNAANMVSRTFEVLAVKQEQTITFSVPESKVYGDVPFDLTATSTSGLEVTYTSSDENVATISGNTVTILGAGTTVITASQPGNEFFESAPDIERNLSIDKADQTIMFNELDAVTFGDESFNLAATSSSGLPVSFLSSNGLVASIDQTEVIIVGAGSAIITATQDGGANFNAATVDQTLIVNKASQMVVFSPSTIPDQILSAESISLDIYGNPHGEGELNVSISSGPATISETGPDFYEVIFTGDGEVIIEAMIESTANYESVSDQLSFLITDDSKENQTISFGVLESKIYGDPSFDLSATASSNLEVSYSSSNENVASISGNTVNIHGAGTTVITATQQGNESFNAALSVSQELIVSKADQTISFQEIPSKSLGDSEFELIADASSGLNVSFTSSNQDVATVSGNIVTIVGAGSTIITALQEGDLNYNPASPVEQTLTLTSKQSQTINFESIPTKTFGEEDFIVSVSATSGLPVILVSSNTAVATISNNTISIVGAGITTITASQNGDDGFEPANSVSREMIVNKADQTISFEALPTKIFGDLDFTLNAMSSSGLVVSYSSSDESVATISGNTVSIVGAGATQIVASQSGNTNYKSAVDVSQSLTIEKGDQVITFDPISDVNISVGSVELNAVSNIGLAVEFSVISGPATVNGTTVSLTGTGNILIEASQAGNSNYKPASAQQSFVVTDDSKQEQTITFEALSIGTFGDTPFNLTATASSGLDISYTSSNESVATISGNQVTIIGAGTTLITASQPGNETYEAAANVTQELIVEKANQIITFKTIEEVSVGESVGLSAIASSGLQVSFEVEGPASLDGTSLAILDQGTVTITASQPGDDNWNQAELVSQTLEITATTLGVSDETILIYPNPFTEVLHLNHAEPVDVRIYGMSGSLVWSKSEVKEELNVSALDEGMYVLEVESAQEITRLRIRKVN